MFLSAARLDVPPGRFVLYLAGLPVVPALAGSPLEFTAPVTVITGENGTGKSTLIEALAVGMGLNPEGGFRHARFATLDEARSVSSLHRGLRLPRSRNPRDAFFLRGESFYNVATEFGNNAPGVANLHRMSHGESAMQVVRESFHGGGLYLLDEPESGLSLIRQMTLLAELHRATDHRDPLARPAGPAGGGGVGIHR